MVYDEDGACTLILELGFNMMYLMEPWMFSVQEASQVTLLSCRTSFHFVPGGGLGCFESLKHKKPTDSKVCLDRTYTSKKQQHAGES